ncbi:MAG: kelch repeat-containing protein, partial [Bacteroidota bacterium]
MRKYLQPLGWMLGLFTAQFSAAQDLMITEVAPMPEAVTNNAVVEGTVGGVPYVYSFGGIGAGKTDADIHQRCYRYNTQTDTWESLPDLPDTLGKIAASANRIGDIIYIIGGYHVLPDSSELSSDRVHRFDINTNTILSDGAPVLIPID